jgi:hypothetical protein
LAIGGRHARRAAGAFTIAPVQDHVVVDRDGVQQSVLRDVGDEPLELGAFNERKDVCEGKTCSS